MMVGWHHQLNGNEFEPTAGDGDGQGSLACCSPWGSRVGHVERLNNNNIKLARIKGNRHSTILLERT